MLLGLRRFLNGSMVSVMLNANDTWLIRPNHERMSVRFFGVGKSEMAFTYFLYGFTVLLPISKPANSTSSLAKWICLD